LRVRSRTRKALHRGSIPPATPGSSPGRARRSRGVVAGSLLIRRERFIVSCPGHFAPLYVSHESWRGRGPELISLAGSLCPVRPLSVATFAASVFPWLKISRSVSRSRSRGRFAQGSPAGRCRQGWRPPLPRRRLRACDRHLDRPDSAQAAGCRVPVGTRWAAATDDASNPGLVTAAPGCA
jgi:hypothetical protein